MNFNATLARVLNRGIPPIPFLQAIVAFGKTAPDEIFVANNRFDIYSLAIDGNIMNEGETNIQVRRAVMMEMMRVHGMFESSGNFAEGVDTTNRTSLDNIQCEETGAWQVSFNSVDYDPSLLACIGRYQLADNPEVFIDAMKSNRSLACEYYARLVRFSVRWAGPLISIRGNPPAVLAWLSPAAVKEFQTLIK